MFGRNNMLGKSRGIITDATPRLVRWLARQDNQVQTAILSTGDDDHSKQLGLKLLKQMASTK